MTAVTLIKELFLRSQLLWFSLWFWSPNPIGVIHLMRLCASQTLFYVILFWCQTMHLGLVSSQSNCCQQTFIKSFLFCFQWFVYGQMMQPNQRKQSFWCIPCKLFHTNSVKRSTLKRYCQFHRRMIPCITSVSR